MSIEADDESSSTPRNYTVDGVIFTSLKSLSVAAGISYAAAVKRKERGFSDQEIYWGRKKTHRNINSGENDSPSNIHAKTINGIEYKNLLDAHRKIKPKTSYNTIRQRLNYGWSLEQAFEIDVKIDGRKLPKKSTPRKPRQSMKLSVDGKEYLSIKELADAYNISTALVYNRIRDNGWTPERAVKESPSDPVTIDGVTYRSSMSAWEAIGTTNFPTYQARKTQGLPITVCLGLAPLPTEGRYEIGDRVYSTLPKVAEAFGLTLSQLHGRLNKMSLEDAVRHVPANGRYSLKRFIEEPDLAQSTGILYFVRIVSQSGVLHKIGITLQSLDERFKNSKYDIIATFSGSMKNVFLLEQEILRSFRDYNFRGDEDFEGKTEMFLLMPDEESNLLSELQRLSPSFGLCMV